MKKEKGSVTLFVLISCMFMIVILLVVNIGVMNKNRSQEKELEEISKQYSQNETDLNNSYDEIIDENEYLTKNEILELMEKDNEYHVGDMVLIHDITTAGFITSNGTVYMGTISLDKKLSKEIKSCTMEAVGGVKVMQDGKYLLGSGSQSAIDGFEIEDTTNLNPSEDKPSGNYVRVSIRVPKKHENAISNSAIGIIIYDLSITFK